MAWFLDQMGFRTHVIEGGYKAFRAAVMTELEVLPKRLDFRVVCGRTGSGKTRLLHALREAGAQVLDLEGLANHRGSVLGILPGIAQPTQRAFETDLWNALRRFEPGRPVYVESESKKVGNLRVPEQLIGRMREHSPCLHVQMPDSGRLALLLEDYGFFARDVELFCTQLDCLLALRGRAVVEGWKAGARAGRMAEVFLDLMQRHYDPGYLKSMRSHFKGCDSAQLIALESGSPQHLTDTVQTLMRTA